MIALSPDVPPEELDGVGVEPLAQRLYQAYLAGEPYATWLIFSAGSLPNWDRLPARERDRWRATARQAIELL